MIERCTASPLAPKGDDGRFDLYVAMNGRNDRHAVGDRESTIRHDDKAASRLAPKGDDGRFDLYVAMNGRSDWLDLE